MRKTFFALLLLATFAAHSSLLTLSLTNSLGLPDTNAIKVVQADTNTPTLANGQPVTIGSPARVQPDTNGTVQIFRMVGNYILYGPTLGQGLLYRFPDSSSNATAYPLPAFNTFYSVTLVVNTNASGTNSGSGIPLIGGTGFLVANANGTNVGSIDGTIVVTNHSNAELNGLLLDGGNGVTIDSGGNISAVGSYYGNGHNLTSLNPAFISSGTAAINISGNAATATALVGQFASDTITAYDAQSNLLFGVNGTNVSGGVITIGNNNSVTTFAGTVIGVGVPAGVVTNVTMLTPNGTNDSTLTLQAALNKGGTFTFNPGVYYATNLVLTNNTVIYGYNATVVMNATATNALFYSSPTTTNIYIYGLTVSGGAEAIPWESGPTVVGNPNFNFSSSSGFGQANLLVHGGFTNRSGFFLNIGCAGTLKDCRATGFSGYGYFFYNPFNYVSAMNNPQMHLTDNTADRNYIGFWPSGWHYDIDQGGILGTSADMNASYVSLKGCFATRNTFGINTSADNHNLTGGVISGNYCGIVQGAADNAGHGITASCTINHNTIGFWGQGSGERLAGNLFLANGTIDIYADATPGLQVDGNTFVNGAGKAVVIFTNTYNFSTTPNQIPMWFENNLYPGTWSNNIFTPGNISFAQQPNAATNTYVSYWGNVSKSVQGDSDGYSPQGLTLTSGGPGSAAGLTNYGADQLNNSAGHAANFTNAANTFAGTFSGNGGGLTNLNAAKLTGGPVTNAISTSGVGIFGKIQIGSSVPPSITSDGSQLQLFSTAGRISMTGFGLELASNQGFSMKDNTSPEAGNALVSFPANSGKGIFSSSVAAGGFVSTATNTTYSFTGTGFTNGAGDLILKGVTGVNVTFTNRTSGYGVSYGTITTPTDMFLTQSNVVNAASAFNIIGFQTH